MKTIAIIFSLLVVTTTFAQDKPDPTPVSGKIDWVFDYEQGKQLAAESDKPMFVVFRCER